MEKVDKFPVARNNSWNRVDQKISVLELIGADITGIVTKDTIKQFKTYSTEDMQVLDNLIMPRRTFIPQQSI